MATIKDAAASKLKGTLPNGSYPITNQHEADSAWKLRNNSKQYTSADVINHIRSRVQTLGLKMPGGI